MKTSIYLPDEMAQQARDRGISLSEVTQAALRGAMPDNAFVTVPGISDVRGIHGVEPVLQISLSAMTGGLPDGASAIFLVNALLQADRGHMIDMGTAEPLLKQLSYGRPEPHKFPLYARWRLSAAAIERFEQARAGGNFMLQVTIEYGLMGGTAAPDWRQPHRPIRGPSDQPTQKIIRGSRLGAERARAMAAGNRGVAGPAAPAGGDNRRTPDHRRQARERQTRHR